MPIDDLRGGEYRLSPTALDHRDAGETAFHPHEIPHPTAVLVSLKIDPANLLHLWLTCRDGVYESWDAGHEWVTANKE